SADGNHIHIAVKTRIAEIGIVAGDTGISASISSQGDVVIASAVRKGHIAHRSVGDPANVHKQSVAAKGVVLRSCLVGIERPTAESIVISNPGRRSSGWIVRWRTSV